MIDIQFRAQKCSITDSNYKLSCGTCSEPVEISGTNRKESVHTTQWPEQVKSANTVGKGWKRSGRSSASSAFRCVQSVPVFSFLEPASGASGHQWASRIFWGAGSLHHMAIMRLHRFLAMEFCKSENPIGESSASLSHCHNADYVNNTQIKIIKHIIQ